MLLCWMEELGKTKKQSESVLIISLSAESDTKQGDNNTQTRKHTMAEELNNYEKKTTS